MNIGCRKWQVCTPYHWFCCSAAGSSGVVPLERAAEIEHPSAAHGDEGSLGPDTSDDGVRCFPRMTPDRATIGSCTGRIPDFQRGIMSGESDALPRAGQACRESGRAPVSLFELQDQTFLRRDCEVNLPCVLRSICASLKAEWNSLHQSRPKGLRIQRKERPLCRRNGSTTLAEHLKRPRAAPRRDFSTGHAGE